MFIDTVSDNNIGFIYIHYDNYVDQSLIKFDAVKDCIARNERNNYNPDPNNNNNPDPNNNNNGGPNNNNNGGPSNNNEADNNSRNPNNNNNDNNNQPKPFNEKYPSLRRIIIPDGTPLGKTISLVEQLREAKSFYPNDKICLNDLDFKNDKQFHDFIKMLQKEHNHNILQLKAPGGTPVNNTLFRSIEAVINKLSNENRN